MKFPRTAGLVSAGGVSQLFLARLPALLERLGPVKGASLRVSRRIAHGIRAGHGVSDYKAFAHCDLILLSLPDRMLDAEIRELGDALNLAGKMIVICETMRDSRSSGLLLASGAQVATLNVLPRADTHTFIAEGHPAVVTELRALVTASRLHLMELLPGTKPLFLFSVHASTHLLLPWIGAAVECLRKAGVSRREAVRVVYTLGEQSLRAYGRAGSKALNHAEAERFRRTLSGLGEIRINDAGIAKMFREQADWLFQTFLREPLRGQSKLYLAKSS